MTSGTTSGAAPLRHAPSYYAATALPAPDRPPLTDTITADVCVIGGGFTGLSTALHLAEKGYDVVVLEAGPIGFGATGRNGGQICTGYNKSMDQIEKLVGIDGAQACWDVQTLGKDIIRDRTARHDIACDLTWGYLHVAARPGHLGELDERQEEWARYGYTDSYQLTRTELKDRLATEAYHGALWEGNAGHLHPLNFAIGMAAAAGNAGARIFEHSPVTALETGSPATLKTPAGTVQARYVVAAGNAYLGDLIKPLYHRVMPVGSFVLATEPLGADRARGLIRENEAVTDSNNIVDYFRLSGDHRLLFGGRANYSGYVPADLAPYMRPRMLKIFPQLTDVKLDYCWHGNIAITLDRMPHFGCLDGNIFFAHGYSGAGVVLANAAGHLIADAISGTAEKFDVLSRIRHQPFPGGPIRTPMLALGMLYYKLRDILG